MIKAADLKRVNINRNRMPESTLELEMQVVGRFLSKVQLYKIQATLLKSAYFKNDFVREIFQMIKREKHDYNYTYEMLEYRFVSSKEFDAAILKRVYDISTESYSLDELLTFVFFLKHNFVVRSAKRMIDPLAEAKTPQDIEKIAIYLTKLSGFGRIDEGNNWEDISKKLTALGSVFPTNFEWLQPLISGYHRTEMSFIYGAPSHGKSAVMLYEISESIKKTKLLTAKIFLSEMSAGIFWVRTLAKDFNIPHKIDETVSDEQIMYLKETYGDRLIINESLSAEEIAGEMITHKKDMFAIDSLQYVARNTSSNLATAIPNELNMYQMAISNASASLIIVSHINEGKLKEVIRAKKADDDPTKLFTSCMPTDDMMEWSSACGKLGRRNISIMRPYKITGRDVDKNRFFMCLTKNSHGDANIKKEVFLNAETFNFIQGGSSKAMI